MTCFSLGCRAECARSASARAAYDRMSRGHTPFPSASASESGSQSGFGLEGDIDTDRDPDSDTDPGIPEI